MVTQYKFVSRVIPDNDRAYFSFLEGVVESIDASAQMAVTHSPGKYHFRIVPSSTTYINPLIHELTTLNNLMGIQLQFSKSIKSSGSVMFKLLV